MPFSQSDIDKLHQYIADNGLGKHITVLSDSIQIRSECNGRFRAIIKLLDPSDNTFSVHVYDSDPQSDELGFSYGLPINRMFFAPPDWSFKDYVDYIHRSVLRNLELVHVSLRDGIRSLKTLSCDCLALNRGVTPLDAAIDLKDELDRIIPTILPPELRKDSVSQANFLPYGNPPV